MDRSGTRILSTRPFQWPRQLPGQACERGSQSHFTAVCVGISHLYLELPFRRQHQLMRVRLGHRSSGTSSKTWPNSRVGAAPQLRRSRYQPYLVPGSSPDSGDEPFEFESRLVPTSLSGRASSKVGVDSASCIERDARNVRLPVFSSSGTGNVAAASSCMEIGVRSTRMPTS